MHRILVTGVIVILAWLAPNALHAELVNSERYQSWARHKPGTTVTRTIDSKVGAESSTSDVKHTLVEVTAEMVVLQVEIRATHRGRTRSVPATRVEVLAKSEKSDDLLGTNYKADFKELRTESAEIGGKTLTCRVIEFSGQQIPLRGGEPIKVSGFIWVSQEIPGAIVQVIQNAEVTAPDGTKVEAVTNTAVAAVATKE